MDEYSVQSPGFINRLKNRLTQIDQRTAFDAFIVLLILVGLAASVFLAGQRQIFRSRASGNGSAEVVDEQGNAVSKEGENFIVGTQQIRLKIDFPTNWQSQRLLPPYLFSPAYAAEAAQCLNQTETFCRGTTCINANYYDDSTKAFIRDGNVAGCYQCSPSCSSSTAPQPTSTTIPTATPTPVTCLGTGGKCASPDAQERGVTSEGLLCSSYLSNRALDTSCANTSPGYNYCYLNCAAPQPTRPPAVAQPNPTPTSSQLTASRPVITRTDLIPSVKLDVSGENFGTESGIVYYSRGGTTEERVYNLGEWSNTHFRIEQTSNPVKITPRDYLRVCRKTDGQCSDYTVIEQGGSAAPQTPTSTTAPAVGAPLPPPTATPIPEEPMKVRISLVQAYVQKDGQCVRNEVATQDCLEFGAKDPYFYGRGNVADWYLPSEPGPYTIYIGFFSDKGTYKAAPPVKVTYRPKQTLSTGGPQSTVTPTGTGKECTSDADVINGTIRTCVDRENKNESKNICSGGQLNVGYNCPSSHPYCLIGSDVTCSPQSAKATVAQQQPQVVDSEGNTVVNKGPCPGAPRFCVSSLTLNKDGETCRGDEWSTLYTGCPEQFPICIAKNAHCSKTNAPPPLPTPPTLIPSLEETPNLLQNDTLYIQNATDHFMTINYIEVENVFFTRDKIYTGYIELSPGANYTYSTEVNSRCSFVDNITHASKAIKLEYYDFKERTTKVILGTYVCKEKGLITIR